MTFVLGPEDWKPQGEPFENYDDKYTLTMNDGTVFKGWVLSQQRNLSWWWVQLDIGKGKVRWLNMNCVMSVIRHPTPREAVDQ